MSDNSTLPVYQRNKAFKPWNKRDIGATGTFSMPPLDDDDHGVEHTPVVLRVVATRIRKAIDA